MADEKKTGTITTEVDTTCVCGRKVSVGRSEDGVPCVLHVEPTCDAFNRIEDPIEFLAYLNRAKGPN